MLLNYHISRFVHGLLCVGVWVRLGWDGIRDAGSPDTIPAEWRRLHNEELNDLYFSPSLVRVISSRRMRWAGHVARKGEVRDVYRALVGNPRERRHF